jgi:hypothetical protein
MESSDNLVHNWITHCRDNSRMHDMSRAYFRMYNMLTTIPSIILASVSGVSMLGIATKDANCNNNTAVIILGVCGLLSGTLMSINRFLRYPELQENHDIYGDSFQILYHEIELQHVISGTPDSVFKSRIEFMKHCKHRMDILIDKAPSIPGAIRTKFLRIGKTSPMKNDAVSTCLQKIELV